MNNGKAERRDDERQKPAKNDSLLSAICHDLRAPLAAVTMGANFVLQSTDDDETNARSRKILEAMLRSCAQMERLIRNFADLSEIEDGSVELRVGVHDVTEMSELAIEALEPVARAKSVTLALDSSARGVSLTCDRDRVLRAIGHLLENAVKAAPEGSTVTLSASAKGAVVELAVTDHGSGLTTQVRANAFDRHWHVQQRGRVGSGFGLAIARGYALAHRGKLSFQSEPGNTTFTMALPLDARPATRP